MTPLTRRLVLPLLALLLSAAALAAEEPNRNVRFGLPSPAKVLSLPDEAEPVLMQAPHRTPAQPEPPTDPFIYRLYEVVMLYGPVFKDVAHELFGDGIMSAIDMSVDIDKVEEPAGVPRMVLSLNGKWLQYKKF
jgi:cyanate lyase